MSTPLTNSEMKPNASGVTAQLKQSFSAHTLWWFIGTVLVVRTFFILLSPVDLIADESYYWDWSRRLDFGYYSKPPMIAWINWISSSLFGANEFAVRFPAALFGTLGLIWIYKLGADLFAFRVGLVAAVLISLTPGQTAMSFLMTIDAPFLFFWSAALYSFWKMTSEEKPKLFWCALTTFWLGLGFLSKQTMLGFLPLGGLFLLVTPSRRHLCLSARVWGTAIAGLLFLLPVLYWNYLNEWITLQHTASHFNETSVTLSTRLARFGEFILGQIGVVSPVLWTCIGLTLWAAFRRFPKLSDAERYLLCFSGVPLVGIIILSATRRLEPNWPAACYPAGIILTSAVLLGKSTLVDLIEKRALWLKRSWQTGLVFSIGTYAAITVIPLSPLAGSPVDITARLRGWKELAQKFETLEKESHALIGSKSPLIISTAGRDITSALAFYLPEQPLIPFWSQDNAGVHCQYDLWKRPDLKQHEHVLVISEVNPQLPGSLWKSFSQWQSLGTIAVELGGGRSREYELFKASCTPIVSASSPSAIPRSGSIAAQPASQSTHK